MSMAPIRGIFRVTERRHYHNGKHVLARLESTQVTSQMFGAWIELMLTDPAAIEKLTNGCEVEVVMSPIQKAIAPAPLR